MPRVKGREKKKAWRPQLITDEQLRDVERAVAWGWGIEKACDYADIRHGTFYDYQRRHPEYRGKIKILRDYPVLAAKKVVAEAVMAGDLRASMWVLERRSEEYHAKRGRPAAEDVVTGDEVLRAALDRLAGRR